MVFHFCLRRSGSEPTSRLVFLALKGQYNPWIIINFYSICEYLTKNGPVAQLCLPYSANLDMN